MRHCSLKLTVEDITKIIEELKKIAKVKVVTPDKHALRYEMVNSKVKLSSVLVGEIQVNTPGMIYASRSEEMARQLIGDKMFDYIKNKTKLEPNKSHIYYEEFRTLDLTDPKRNQVVQKGSHYHQTIREAAAEFNN